MSDNGAWRMSAEDAEEYTQALGQVMSGGWRQIVLAQRLGVPDALGMTTQAWVNERIGGYVRLGLDERREACKALTDPAGEFQLTQRQAAEVLGVSQMTVSRDLQDEPDVSQEDAPLGDDSALDDADVSVEDCAEPSVELSLVDRADAPTEDDDQDAEAEVIEALEEDDDGGEIERARLLAQYSAGVRDARRLMMLHADAIAGVLPLQRHDGVAGFCADMRRWCDELEAALRRPMRAL